MPVAVANTEVIIDSSTESLEILLGQITTAAGDKGQEMAPFAWAGFAELRGKCECWLVQIDLFLQPCTEHVEWFMKYLASTAGS